MTCECYEKVRVGVVNLDLDYTIELPVRATEQAAGYDVFACIRSGEELTGWNCKNVKAKFPVTGRAIEFHPGDRILIPTGISLIIPKGYCVKVYPRSGLSVKQGLTLINNVGIIDSDYTGELLIPLINLSDQFTQVIDREKIAQIMVEKLVPTFFYEEETAELMNHAGESNRKFGDSGGFGSTGL